MADEFEACDVPPRLATLAFTCLDCGHRFTRLIRGEPMLVNRCFACDHAALRRTSERILALVFDVTAP